jgi:hypothetical protein
MIPAQHYPGPLPSSARSSRSSTVRSSCRAPAPHRLHRRSVNPSPHVVYSRNWAVPAPTCPWPAAGLHQPRLQYQVPPPTSNLPSRNPFPKPEPLPPASGRNPRRPDSGRLLPRPPPPPLPSPYSSRPRYMALKFMIKPFKGSTQATKLS